MSALMGIDAALLEAMLTKRMVKTGREEFTKKLGVQDAALSRDAVVKALFQVRKRLRTAEPRTRTCAPAHIIRVIGAESQATGEHRWRAIANSWQARCSCRFCRLAACLARRFFFAYE